MFKGLIILASLQAFAALPIRDFSVRSVAARIAAANPTNGLSRFVGYPAGADKDRFRPNTNFWARGVDFSCASPWNSCGGRTRAGTLISRRHIIFAKHYPIAAGSRILFVDDEGGVCPCYVDKTKALAACDIMVASLDAEVTPNIVPAKILPPDAGKYLGRGEGLPVVTFNQVEKLFLNELNAIPTNGSPWKSMSCRVPNDGRWQAFRERLIVGDSGDPAFLLVGDRPILVYCVQGGGCGSGPAIHLHRREIQAAMDELCPGYKLENFDFTGDGKKGMW